MQDHGVPRGRHPNRPVSVVAIGLLLLVAAGTVACSVESEPVGDVSTSSSSASSEPNDPVQSEVPTAEFDALFAAAADAADPFASVLVAPPEGVDPVSGAADELREVLAGLTVDADSYQWQDGDLTVQASTADGRRWTIYLVQVDGQWRIGATELVQQ